MENLVTRSMYSMLERHAGADDRIDVAVGLRPSGIIHLGNMATLTLAGMLSRNIGPHLSQVNTTICDLDMPDAKDWPIAEKKYVRYFGDIPDSDECHPNLLSHALEGIVEFTRDLGVVLGVRYDIQLLSQIQKQKGFRDGLKKVLEVPGLTRYLNHHFNDEKKALVFPICPECRSSNPLPSSYSDGHLLTNCSNPECGQYEKETSMDVLDCTRDLAVHFFIDPLRDRTTDPKSKVHVFGGDYTGEVCDEDDCCGRGAKIEKILKVMNIAGEGDIPDILLGPTFYTKEGAKMSKSQGGGLTLTRLKQHLGVSYAERITNMMEDLVREDYRVVPYQFVHRELFHR